MTNNPLEAAMCRVLNDRRIFGMPQELIDRSTWSKFRAVLAKDDMSQATSILEAVENALARCITNEGDAQRRQQLEENRTLLSGLKAHVNKGSALVRNLADLLDTFGPLRSNLPNMEDFGKVIEGHGRATAEQFFLYKIQKEKDQRRRAALNAVFEVVLRLYDQRVNPMEIAFFVRKAESLTQIVEVMKWEPSRL